ncbi:MAG: hypothetical protein E7167_02820 [Firmicutes bacterium]|nr:hypothetical protein [Bacillota bacterium]
MKINKLKLNFLDSYYMFYDWLDTDEIESNLSLMVYKVSSKVVSDFISYNIKLNDLSILKDGNALLFTDSYTYIAIEFDKDGNSLYKSSLLLEDELRLNTKVDTLKNIKVNYEILSENQSNKDLRINEEIRKTIKVELNNLYHTKNEDKIKYLYYEWFQKAENDIEKMIKCMNKKIDMPLTILEKNIYDLIKKSYKLV